MSHPSLHTGPAAEVAAVVAADGIAKPEAPGFYSGARAFFGGIRWLLSTPSVWPAAVVPVAIALSLTAAFSAASLAFVPDYIQGLIGPVQGRWAGLGAGLLAVLATALAILFAGLLALAVAQPLSGPALERVVRQQEKALGGKVRPPVSFLADVGRSLQSTLIGLLLGGPALALLFLLGVIFPVAAVVLVPLKFLVGACTVAWDWCDYPLAVSGLPIGHRLSVLGRHKRAVLGFGVALSLLALVPCVFFFLLPAGVAGATRLIFEIQRFEASAQLGEAKL